MAMTKENHTHWRCRKGRLTSRRWPKNLAGGRIFARSLRLCLTSKRGETNGVDFAFDRPSTRASASSDLGSSGSAAEFQQKLTFW
ncbi:hypothetical protein PanWU01x14_290710 [Parasponia andersonii]|uniref:Uncharacterized protein n=1 Tax=Parasponia andersonii TaxID=3476 RepID=A0A2P5AXM9_PARAD|nr:hypothetical protein PanWU01x14_290710 [Parasponia andersonii]